MGQSKFLDSVSQDKVFRLSNGAVADSLEQLLNVLKSADDYLFFNHVTNDRNDFASWIKYCVLSEDIYRQLLNIKNRTQFINILESEINALKNPQVVQVAPGVVPDITPTAVNPAPEVSAASSVDSSAVSASNNSDTSTNAVSTNAVSSSADVISEIKSETSSVSVEVFEFEQIFVNLINEIDLEILNSD